MGEKQKRRYFFWVAPKENDEICLFLYNLFAKWSQCQACELEVLATKRNTDDGDAKQNAEGKVCQTDPNATQYNPEEIHDDTQASTGLRSRLNALAERAEGKQTNFQCLDTEWNTDDGDHHAYTGHDVFYSSNYTT